ncbi:MAG: hypothetical protein COV99_02990 [Bacteroidetes bacterium CG12_big_fil_rev_8_21_14_0_65_60_17]|nr:MAG: hypothetical protein COV99_02990 [Bacteroidetes bacterium CG12_big_fil_rev_8_21_14_0_65_60_17]
MQRFLSVSYFVLVAALVPGCDFQAVEDALDDFNVVIGLESVNTVINGTVVDASTGNLVPARLTFSGNDAPAIIDAFSDPVSEIDADAGIVTFGIVNSVVPSPASPVEIVVTAEAEGFHETSRTLRITETGDASFNITLTPVSVTAPIRGTQSSFSSGLQTTGGTVQQDALIETPLAAQSTAQASLAVPAGTTPLTRSGAPLSGALTTELRVFDSASGTRSIPSGARAAAGVANASIVGATYFRMSDASGSVVASFRGPQGKSGSACSDGGGTSLRILTRDAALVAAFPSMANPTATVSAWTPADGQNNQVASGIPVTLDGDALVAELCFGGSAANVDASALGDVSHGVFYTYALVPGGGATLETGRLNHQVSISNPSASAVNAVFTLVGPGLQETNGRQIGPGTTVLSLADLFDNASEFSVLSGASFILTATSPTGASESTVVSPSPLSGASTLNMPSNAGLETYSVSATLQCPDPVNQKFEVQVTTESLDAVSAFYRVASSDDAWTLVRRADISRKEATSSSISIEASLSLLPSTNYAFRGVLGDDSSETVQMTPATGTAWTVTLTPDDVGLTCEAR